MRLTVSQVEVYIGSPNNNNNNGYTYFLPVKHRGVFRGWPFTVTAGPLQAVCCVEASWFRHAS